tara:strand:- start:4630 stop:5115 length:486 start_codon:yes stop_codon:yes gene_type:complete
MIHKDKNFLPHKPRVHWLSILKLILENKYKIIAEIGVMTSRTSKHLIRSARSADNVIKEYWAVDPWEFDTSQEMSNADQHILGMTPVLWEQYYRIACAAMVTMSQYRALKLLSTNAAKLFNDSYFDLVYIDALHTYDAVLADIKAWLPKVKKGGIISGTII